ncbi:MAG TPA: phosphate acyltransferase PlsX [Candidatus Hydrogenedentes bacterium]|nr:phosphate acyltransferase PlsX [Candidatus Hydrogenedentota bacterium]
MRIAVDAMGSDRAPDVEVEGAVTASLESDTEILLVGDEAVLNEKLAKFTKHGAVSVVHATEAIKMNEPPVMAIRKKRDSSLMVAMRLVKENRADAFVSAGNTGAVVVAARTILGPLRGVARSAICQCLPTATGRVVLIDLGANVDCSTRQLCEFAEMGIAYSHYALGVENPRVGLLNIGEEVGKGGQVAKEVHQNLSAAAHVNFIGNIEPKAMYRGEADVVVCDGFVGNIILKTSEAVASLMGKLMREKLESSNMSKFGAVLARKSLYDLKKTIDPNEYPGAPLLGVNGVVIIIHGSSTPRGVSNAILGARTAFETKLNEHIHENIELLRKTRVIPLESSNETLKAPAEDSPEETPLAETA